MAGIPAAILVQEVNSRIKFIHNGGETDIRLEHNDYGVTISALDCPSWVPFYIKNKFLSCLSHCILDFSILNTKTNLK